MGKITSIYLTDEEAKRLEKFCDENQCTQYSALKIALQELISKPLKESKKEETSSKDRESPQQISESERQTENTNQIDESKYKHSTLKRLLRKYMEGNEAIQSARS